MQSLKANITRQPAPITKQLNVVNSAKPSAYYPLSTPDPLQSITTGLEVLKDTVL